MSPYLSPPPRPKVFLLGRALTLGLIASIIAATPGCGEKQPYQKRPDVKGPGSSQGASPVAPQAVPNLVADLEPAKAEDANAAIPFASEKIEVALPIVYGSLSIANASKDASVECLTAAIYYEAGSETIQGQRAVAQVVLNRVRHPSFPNSVCDVVYQGSNRRTGCQFTFTCDGSLRRTPSPRPWLRAQQIAQQALQGWVEPSVGMATHYHTDWVFPYWAPTLKKINKLLTHIFYTWPGRWGRRFAFNQQPIWRGLPTQMEPSLPELIAAPFLANEQPTTALRPPPLKADLAGAIITPNPTLGKNVVPRLKADERSGTLIADVGR